MLVSLCLGVSICYFSCSNRHHCGLQGGSARVPRWSPDGVFSEPLLPVWHGEVRTSKAASVKVWDDPCWSLSGEPISLLFREKFWRVGNKERDGEYGACFFPQNRGLLVGQPPLLYCARPGSRVWEASFNGEVLSTHQFKQLLACPPLPLITYRYWLLLFYCCPLYQTNISSVFWSHVPCRNEPHYNPEQKSSQSIAFPKLLFLG